MPIKHMFTSKESTRKQKKFYHVWKSMRQRCRDKNVSCYKNYGGRGISVCERWNKFINFYEDMWDGYRIGLSIERVDNDKGYMKENCKWIDFKNQSKNRRNVKLVEFQGKKMTLPDWARHLGLKETTVGQRYFCYKFPIERVLSTEKGAATCQ